MVLGAVPPDTGHPHGANKWCRAPFGICSNKNSSINGTLFSPALLNRMKTACRAASLLYGTFSVVAFSTFRARADLLTHVLGPIK
jgi:hypothetical protein